MNVRRMLVLSAAPLLFADYLGIPPRPSSADYAAHADSASVSVGASAAASAQVRKVFGWDWTSHYLFFEVALYPAGGAQLTVAPRDFMPARGSGCGQLEPGGCRRDCAGPEADEHDAVRGACFAGGRAGQGNRWVFNRTLQPRRVYGYSGWRSGGQPRRTACASAGANPDG